MAGWSDVQMHAWCRCYGWTRSTIGSPIRWNDECAMVVARGDVRHAGVVFSEYFSQYIAVVEISEICEYR